MDSAKLLSLTRTLIDVTAEKKKYNREVNEQIKKLKEDIEEEARG